jgi:hypothetical protein
MCTLPSAIDLAAGIPVTCTLAGDAAALAGTMAYQRPAVVGRVKVAADVDGTTIAFVPPSITVAACPGHGLRTLNEVLAPASKLGHERRVGPERPGSDAAYLLRPDDETRIGAWLAAPSLCPPR